MSNSEIITAEDAEVRRDARCPGNELGEQIFGAAIRVHSSYLKLGNFKLGYLLNFNVPRMKDSIKRIVNGL